MKSMVAPIFAGILSALRRVITRRISLNYSSLQNQLKRRLHAITIASATCFLFPVAMWDMIVGSTNVELPFSAWAFSSTILFGVILIFYVDIIIHDILFSLFNYYVVVSMMTDLGYGLDEAQHKKSVDGFQCCDVLKHLSSQMLKTINCNTSDFKYTRLCFLGHIKTRVDFCNHIK